MRACVFVCVCGCGCGDVRSICCTFSFVCVFVDVGLLTDTTVLFLPKMWTIKAIFLRFVCSQVVLLP